MYRTPLYMHIDSIEPPVACFKDHISQSIHRNPVQSINKQQIHVHYDIIFHSEEAMQEGGGGRFSTLTAVLPVVTAKHIL